MTDEVTEQSLIRQEYLTTFFKKYAEMVGFINSIPMHQQFKLNAITRFDEFMFWVREGIINLPTMTPEESLSTEQVSEPTPLS